MIKITIFNRPLARNTTSSRQSALLAERWANTRGLTEIIFFSSVIYLFVVICKCGMEKHLELYINFILK